MMRRMAALLVALVGLAGCGESQETVATTNNCAGLPAKEYQECVTEDAINGKVGFESSPMSEDEEAELEGRSPP
jgi:ABC-type glycerol-3-phosphate transport system substrate-binding protein